MSATNVARAGKRENICVGNNVSVTMCPCLPGPLQKVQIRIGHPRDHLWVVGKRHRILLILSFNLKYFDKKITHSVPHV